MSAKTGSQQRKRLGDILVDAGLITADQLQDALSKQKTLGKRLGKVLVESGLATEDSIANTLARQMNIPFLNNNLLK